ncbi:hypothetical protein AMS68_007662 [Peltaster fructicola]|uniref:Heterokaryon incompatibility domain-containing protein n=1 Tax=Peltaster fructicola TaxID=286661 RepID=A0A6H0Y5G5_9PEZI|nr:hypothetical protein AMS68_007662 [Peltaster fructicola]
MAEAVRQAVLDQIKDSNVKIDTLTESHVVDYFDLPIFEVFGYECAARDQWELDFKPIARIVKTSTLSKEYEVELPQRTFKIYATYYDSVRPLATKVDVAERFRAYKAKHDPRDDAYDKSLADLRHGHVYDSIDIPPGITNSRDSFDQFHSWLKSCKNHERCITLGTTDFVPSRLIDVGSGDSVRLVETGGHKTYTDELGVTKACNNHCWGSWVEPTLQTTNIDEFKKSIRLNVLPRNFQDAVVASRLLNIQYIWIDSLCIVQNSREDKGVQLPAMHKIYGCSYLNLAAANSYDCHGGFFRNRDLSVLSSTVRVGSVECRVVRKDFWAGELLTEPLYKRAWVLQERTLSPRTLNFGRQAFWQCLHTTACEIMPNGVPLVIDSGKDELKWRRLLHQEEFTRQDKVDLQGVWRHMVNTYKTCQITQKTDALPALDGLVTKMHSISKEEYVAGLWRNNLVEQLAWRVLKPNARYDVYCAPTWAWAQIDGPVELPPRVVLKKDYELGLLEVHVKPKEGAPGQIERSWLTVQGFVLSTELGNFHPDVPEAVQHTVVPLYYQQRNDGISGMETDRQ